jgi:pimeloyl-ACP methyl ester carboxylesterase
MDERSYIARVESADANELAGLMTTAAGEEETVLREYLGEERFEYMRELALQRQTGVATQAAAERGNVVVTHGIMGSSLSAVGRAGGLDLIWIDLLNLVFGRLDRLRLNSAGSGGYRPEYDVRATGILKRFYGEMVLSLRSNWNVYTFYFDWRKDLSTSAHELKAQIDGHFGPDAPVHIVAHSMGGLVARTLIRDHRERWEKMWDDKSSGKLGGRLVMLGTPNHGSFAIPLLINGLGGAVRTLAWANVRHELPDLLEILNSFVGTYQMLPSLHVMPEMEPLYLAETYKDLEVPRNVPQGRLDNARKFHDELRDVVDAGRMIYVAGYDRWTVDGIDNFSLLHKAEAYRKTREGDGTVPHRLGFLETPDGEKVKTYFVEEGHSDLARSRQVIAATDQLLETGITGMLSEEIPTTAWAAPAAEPEGLPDAQTVDKERVRFLVGRAGEENENSEPSVAAEERELEELLLHGI